MKFEMMVKGKISGVLIFDDHDGILKNQYTVTYIPSGGEISTGGVPQKVRVNAVEIGVITKDNVKRLAKAS